MEIVCLSCGHIFPTRKDEVDGVRQCPSCGSSELAVGDEVLKTAALAESFILPKVVPVIDNIAAMFVKGQTGKYRVSSLIALENILWLIRKKRLNLAQAVAETFPETT